MTVSLNLKQIEELVIKTGSLSKVMLTDFPLVVSWKLSRIYKQLTEEYKTLFEVRKSAYLKYGEDAGDGLIKIKPEFNEAFSKEFNDLNNKTIEFDFETVTLKELSGVNLSPADIYNLVNSGILVE
jgi:hypothetical protein